MTVVDIKDFMGSRRTSWPRQEDFVRRRLRFSRDILAGEAAFIPVLVVIDIGLPEVSIRGGINRLFPNSQEGINRTFRFSHGGESFTALS
jgi:hypothetical protein